VTSHECSDDAQARIAALKERADKEHQNYLQEVKDLDRQLEQDRRLKEFLNIKIAERNENLHNLKKNMQGSSCVLDVH
jgi:hypothetical protein